jgi:hypothetical protein
LTFSIFLYGEYFIIFDIIFFGTNADFQDGQERTAVTRLSGQHSGGDRTTWSHNLGKDS